MDSRMIGAAQTGNIGALYELIRGDPYVLERIDQVPFVDTPLHLAACTEHLSFVKELMNLKPSFSRKLNQDGLSPMHSALQCGNNPAVLWLLKFDKGLVRVKGKESMTLLHHAVQLENLDIMIEFLEACPEAIEDVNARDETAFHIALKHDRFTAFEVLIGWLTRSCHKAAKSWEKELLMSGGDMEGNTILHIAVIKKRHSVVKLLLKYFSHDYINAKNLEGLTAVDIARLQHERDDHESQSDNQQIYDMLNNTRRGLICSLNRQKPNNNSTKIDSLRSKMSYYNKFKTAIARGKDWNNISEEMRNTFLVVTVLIITATYNAAASPPEKDQQSNIVKAEKPFLPGEPPPAIALPDAYSLFWLYNTLTFWAAVGLTASLLPNRLICLFLLITLSLFGVCYMLLMVAAISSDMLRDENNRNNGNFSVRIYLRGTDSGDWYYYIFLVNLVFSMVFALLVAYRIARYVCLKLAEIRRQRVLLFSIWVVSFLLIFVSIVLPAWLYTEAIYDFYNYPY